MIDERAIGDVAGRCLEERRPRHSARPRRARIPKLGLADALVIVVLMGAEQHPAFPLARGQVEGVLIVVEL